MMRLIYEKLSRLPKGYKEVEYLESTGTQYINTGVLPTQLTKAKIDIQYTNVNHKQAVLGSNNGASGDAGWNNLFGTNENSSTAKPTYFWCQWGASFDGPVTKDTNRHTHTFERNGNSSWTYSVDSSSKTITSGIATQTNPKVLYLFACNNNGTLYRQAKAKVYQCQIWNNGTLVRDYIPCLDNNDVPCMWDNVTQQAFYNQGTGEFSYGRQIIPVEYLESTGTQYIDTGFTPNQNTKTELDYKITRDLSTGFPLFGSRISASSNGYSYQRYSSGVMGGQYGSNIANSTVSPDLNRHIVIRDKNKIYLDGIEIASNPTSTFTCPGNLYLNAMNNNGTASTQNVGVAYYSMKIYDNGTLVRDYIPCKDENGVGYMFDKVTHTCYLNAGTGNFTYGDESPKKRVKLLKVPNGFTEVEYIESTGTQYIDTGINAKSTLKTDIHFEVVDKTQGGHIFGGRTVTSGGRGYGVYLPTSGGIGFDYETRLSSNISTTNGYKYRVIKDGASNTLYVNGVQSYTGNNTASTFDLNVKIALFYMKDSNTTFNASVKCKVFYFKIWDDDVLVRDFIPCIDARGIACLFDKVQQKAYYNQGAGTFNYGHQIIPVEYLESTGTQYINTRYIPNINTECSMNLAFVSLDSTYRTPFSVRTADGATNSFTIMSSRETNDNNSFAFGSNYWSGPSVPKVVLNKTVEAVLRKGYASWDGVSGNPGNSITPTTLTAYMFARNSNGTAGNFFIGRIYDCQLKENDTLVRDYIPCKDENGTGYMLDKVTHTLYPNLGTGTFVLGPQIIKTRFISD